MRRPPLLVKPQVLLLLGAALVSAACQGTILDHGAAAGAAPSASGAGGVGVVTAAECELAAGATAGAGTWRRLTGEQYRNTVSDLLGVTADTSGFLHDTRTGPFATNALLAAQETDIDNYQTAAAQIAADAVGNLPRLLGGCDPAKDGQDVCAGRFIDDFGRRAYRHTLTAAQRQRLLAVYGVGKQESFTAGIRLVIEAALQTPQFLYVAEFGAPAGSGPLYKLDGYEVASRLSYFLWNSMPDAELFAKADNGSLADPAQIQSQALRLMQSDRFVDSSTGFHSQLLRVSQLALPGVVTKDPARDPGFDDTLKQAMIAEVRAFDAYLFGPGGATVRAMLTAPVAFPSGPLLPIYGMTAAPPSGRADVVDGSRAGMLTLAAVMTAVPPVPTRHQAVIRGNLVRGNLLCDPVPPPQVAVTFALPPNADQLSDQELLRAHKDNPTCQPCHDLMDPIGFGFENYDEVGHFVTTTGPGQPVDATGYLRRTDVDGNFSGPAQLMAKLNQSSQVRGCLATQWFRYALARDPQPGDGCSLAAVQKALGAGDGDLRAAIQSLVTSDAFRYRRGS